MTNVYLDIVAIATYGLHSALHIQRNTSSFLLLLARSYLLLVVSPCY